MGDEALQRVVAAGLVASSAASRSCGGILCLWRCCCTGLKESNWARPLHGLGLACFHLGLWDSNHLVVCLLSKIPYCF
ncbi:hypothetical protein RchiOBHm_Chr4g0440031 [Rosa chinensis]|uniref:Uncharacterized protein n=1 Tax=Rosa chinensis TaxID=74649 RepID=A0A2P6R304_ROSCH|nr:hypothetical protein RchiOBHm_Chr4g0440031 [Rosa chinensis]